MYIHKKYATTKKFIFCFDASMGEVIVRPKKSLKGYSIVLSRFDFARIERFYFNVVREEELEVNVNKVVKIEGDKMLFGYPDIEQEVFNRIDLVQIINCYLEWISERGQYEADIAYHLHEDNRRKKISILEVLFAIALVCLTISALGLIIEGVK